jgi:hypothetical protein
MEHKRIRQAHTKWKQHGAQTQAKQHGAFREVNIICLKYIKDTIVYIINNVIKNRNTVYKYKPIF